LQVRKKEYDKGEKSLLEALSIRRQLAESNTQKYLRSVAGTLATLAVTLNDKKKYEAAKKH